MVRKCKKNCTNFKKEVAILDLKSTKKTHKLSSVTEVQAGSPDKIFDKKKMSYMFN
jgi:hypothetical protein